MSYESRANDFNSKFKTHNFFNSSVVKISSLAETFVKELQRALPGVGRRFRVVGFGARVIEEAVLGPLVDFEVGLLARLLQSLVELLHLLGRNALVERAEVSEE